jgi:hypothetical protein
MNTPQPKTGDNCPCPDCAGHLVVTTSKRRKAFVVRYLACWRCGGKPENNKQSIPASEVPKRRPRKNRPNKVHSPIVTGKNGPTITA